MANAKLKCRACKLYFPRETMIKVPLGNYCTVQCCTEDGQKRAASQKKQGRKHQEKLERKKHRERKEALKPASKWVQEAQSAVNKYIRIRDHGKPCISCGRLPEQKIGGTMDAGHYRSRGAAGHIRFNCYNIHSQCVSCNRYKSGNANDYRIGLIKRIGLDRVEKLESDNTPKRFDIAYLKRIKTVFSNRARLLAKRKGLT